MANLTSWRSITVLTIGAAILALFVASAFRPTQSISDAECARTLECIKENLLWGAAATCSKLIEKQALHDVRWSESNQYYRFPRVEWSGAADGSVAISGDALALQNGFGAWTPYRYSCDYQPATNWVSNVQLTAGRGLP